MARHRVLVEVVRLDDLEASFAEPEGHAPRTAKQIHDTRLVLGAHGDLRPNVEAFGSGSERDGGLGLNKASAFRRKHSFIVIPSP